MAQKSTLMRIARMIVAERRVGGSLDAGKAAIEQLEALPEHVFDVVDLIIEESARKRPNAATLDALSLILTSGLERIRYRVEAGMPEPAVLVDRFRRRLLQLGERGALEYRALLMILNAMTAAKLELGDDLRKLLQGLGDALPEDDGRAGDDNDLELEKMAKLAGHDPFTLFGIIEEAADAFKGGQRASMATSMFACDVAAVREAALGFLLNAAPEPRKLLAGMIATAPPGIVSPTILRRLIAMRDWLPDAERAEIDVAIGTARAAGTACAGWPQLKVRKVLTSGFDGSGAGTVLILSEQAGKKHLAGLLFKHGFGVRDAWLRRNVKKRELEMLLDGLDGEVDLASASIDYAATALRHFLAVNLETGTPIPFGTLAVAEATGLADVAPAALPLEELVASLLADVDAAKLAKESVANILRKSAAWPGVYGSLESWFEPNVEKLVGASRGKDERRMATLLAGPLQSHRRRWAELTAWFAFALKQQSAEGWDEFAIVAGEILRGRPLDEIGLMLAVARTTLEVLETERLLGRRAA